MKKYIIAVIIILIMASSNFATFKITAKKYREKGNIEGYASGYSKGSADGYEEASVWWREQLDQLTKRNIESLDEISNMYRSILGWN